MTPSTIATRMVAAGGSLNFIWPPVSGHPDTACCHDMDAAVRMSPAIIIRRFAGGATASLHDSSDDSFYEYDAEIVDVGAGGAGDDEVAQRAEIAVAVVVVEEGARLEFFPGGALRRVGREHRAGIVLGAVDAVGVAGEG